MKTHCPLGAAVRSGAGGMRRAAVRAGAAALADPRPIEELRLRTFDLFQVLRPREQTIAPGRHRRYRRGEPQGDRAMAVAADRRGRPRHPPRPSSAPSRSASTSSSPSPIACRRRSAGVEVPRPRRCDARKAARPAEQRRRFWPTRSANRASWSVRPARHRAAAGTVRAASGRPAFVMRGAPDARTFLVSFPGAGAQHLPDRAGRSRPRDCSRSNPET